jgi:hypothetical protein
MLRLQQVNPQAGEKNEKSDSGLEIHGRSKLEPAALIAPAGVHE